MFCSVKVSLFVQPLHLTCKLKVKDNIRDAMIVQLKDEYVSETATDSLSKDWNKMQQNVSIHIVTL